LGENQIIIKNNNDNSFQSFSKDKKMLSVVTGKTIKVLKRNKTIQYNRSAGLGNDFYA